MLLGSLDLVDSWIRMDTRVHMEQIQSRSHMPAVPGVRRMIAGMENVLDTEGLLHLFSSPGADWFRILHRIYLNTL